jgi:hypothetical protein
MRVKAKILSGIGLGSRVGLVSTGFYCSGKLGYGSSEAKSLSRAGLALPLTSGRVSWDSWVRGLTSLGQLDRVFARLGLIPLTRIGLAICC